MKNLLATFFGYLLGYIALPFLIACYFSRPKEARADRPVGKCSLGYDLDV